MQSLDEHSVPSLFQTASANYCAPEQALARIQQNTGFIPVAWTGDHKLVWLDIGDCPLSEWKFRFSIRNLIDGSNAPDCFTTDIEILQSEDLDPGASHQPTGFLFHMSKCGSTVMARILDQSPQHITLKEPTPLHEPFWQYMTQDWKTPIEPSETNLRMIRNLIQIMGRTRLPEQRSYFLRVRSWVVAFVNIIQQAFPDTPTLFMYRDPVEVMASILSKPTTGLPRLKESGAAAFITGRTNADLFAMDDLEYFTAFYKRYLESSLVEMNQHSHYLNYRNLTRQNLPDILRSAFRYSPSEPVLTQMLDQFNVYSKDDSGATRFSSDNREKQRLVTSAMREAADQHLMRYYHALETHDRNLTNARAWPHDGSAEDREEQQHAY